MRVFISLVEGVGYDCSALLGSIRYSCVFTCEHLTKLLFTCEHWTPL